MALLLDWISEFILTNFTVFFMFAGMTVTLTANKGKKVEGTRMTSYITLLILFMVVMKFVQELCVRYRWDICLLYIKETFFYWIFPLSVVFGLHLILPRKRRPAFYIPLVFNFVLVTLNFFGIRLIYSFTDNYEFKGEVLHCVPMLIAFYYFFFYIYDVIKYDKEHGIKKTRIVVFVTVSMVITMTLQYFGLVSNVLHRITMMNMLVYYLYLTENYYVSVQDHLVRSEFELEQIKISLLQGQIKPHFFSNALLAIRSLCYEDTERAIDAINHLSRYTRGSMEIMGSQGNIPFTEELDLVENYLYIENLRFDGQIEVEKILKTTDFQLPALSVQPVVENAVRHGIRKCGEKGKITITTAEIEREYIVIVQDNGAGFDVNKTVDNKKHLGMYNVDARLKAIAGGWLQIESELGKGTIAVIHIPKEV